LAPSVQHKLDSHIRFIEKLKKQLPIKEVIIEVANFDIQKINNPDIEGKGYQEGDMMGFWNLRAMSST
jgi:N6-L-threonylcarbamoyladenine synthase